eukprot:599278-Amphidinium_carterae.1
MGRALDYGRERTVLSKVPDSDHGSGEDSALQEDFEPSVPVQPAANDSELCHVCGSDAQCVLCNYSGCSNMMLSRKDGICASCTGLPRLGPHAAST